MKERIKAYIKEHEKDIVDMLSSLVEIPSVRTAGDPSAPFGEECLNALLKIEEIYKCDGLKTKIEENKNYLLGESDGDEKLIGIFSHADVVPAVESDWIYTKPFSPILKEGFLIGRGAHDNKSGVVGAIWALRALGAVGQMPRSRVLLFSGSDEECGMSDLEVYTKKEELPDFSIIPDNEYPVCRGEKGILNFFLNFRAPFEDILSITGGSAFNIVLGKVDIVLRRRDGLYEEILDIIKGERDCSVSSVDGEITLTAKGKSSHAAHPEGSVNAMTVAIGVLNKTSLSKGDKDILTKVLPLLSDPYFEKVGLQSEDREFGKTTTVNGIAAVHNKRLSLSFDCRYGSEVDADVLIGRYKEYFDKIGADYSERHRLEGYVIPEEADTVKAVMSAWREITGDGDGKPYLSFGGTYARLLPNAVSIGTHTKRTSPLSMPEGHGDVHQPDEALDVEGFLHGIEILAHMIIKIDGALHQE